MTTSKPIRLYAIELEPRDFSITQFTLNNGFEYSGVRLFATHKLAMADIDDDVRQAMTERQDLDPEDEDYKTDSDIRDEMGSVTPLLIHSDGRVLDIIGNDMAAYIGRSEDQSPTTVAQHISQLYAQESQRLKLQRQQGMNEPEV